MVIAFGVGRFPGFCGSQHIRDPTWSQNPFLNRLRSGSNSCFVGFRCFGNFMFLSCCIYLHACSFMFLSFACIFLSLCIQFLSCSFHVPFIGMHFHSCSFHIPFMFIPMCIHVLSSSFHLQACSFHIAFMSFHFLSTVMEMAWWLGQGTECNKWLSLSCR